MRDAFDLPIAEFDSKLADIYSFQRFRDGDESTLDDLAEQLNDVVNSGR